MKKFLAALMAVCIVFAATVPAWAAEDEEDDGGGFFDFSFLTSWMEDWFPKTEVEDPEYYDEQAADVTESASIGFEAVKYFLLGTENNYLFINGPGITKVLADVFLPIGYLVFLICWSISVAQNAMTLELWDVSRGAFLRVLVALLAGILLMGISTQILQLLDQVARSLTADIITNTEINLDAITPKSSIEDYASDIPIIGWIIQIINWIFHLVPTLFYNLAVIVCSLIMAVSLGIRVIKLAIYQGVAPVFFGLVGSRSTAHYFQNFMAQYCAICFQLVITAAIFSAFQVSYAAHLATTSVGNFKLSSFMMGGLVMLIYCIMMVKSDRLFDRVFR